MLVAGCCRGLLSWRARQNLRHDEDLGAPEREEHRLADMLWRLSGQPVKLESLVVDKLRAPTQLSGAPTGGQKLGRPRVPGVSA